MGDKLHELSYKEQKALPLADKLPFLRNAPRQRFVCVCLCVSVCVFVCV